MSESPIIIAGPLRDVRAGERGMALLLTLLVTVILSVVVLEFNYLMRVHATLSSNMVDDLRAEAAAVAGVETAMAALINDMVADSETGIASDTLEEDWSEEIEFDIQSSKAKASVSDEMSKLNLNRLIKRPVTDLDMESTDLRMVESVRLLFESLELDPNLVDVIVDWLDENDEEEPFGAERSYYEGLNPPAGCKNGPIDSLEELLRMEGFGKAILYGDEETRGLAEFVTICGDENGRVNINTAPEEVIAAVTNSESVASMIIGMREDDPFESAEDMATRLPDLDLSEKFTTQSSFFLVSSEGLFFPGGSDGEGVPTREVKISALLKRVSEEQGQDTRYFSIETVHWKAGR